MRNWRLVKIATTKAQRKLFFNLRSMKAELGALTRTRGERHRRDLGVKPEEVFEMETRLSGQDVALDPPAGDDGETMTPIAYLTDGDAEPGQILERAETARNRSDGLEARAVEARQPQPRHHRGALAARGRPGDAAGSRRPVRRVRRADPSDREQGAEDDARRNGAA